MLLHRHTTFFALWVFAAAGLLLLGPAGRVGAPEWIAATAPLLVGLHRHLRRDLLLAVGIAGITLFAVADPGVGLLPRLTVAWAVFGVGIWLADRAAGERRALGELADRLALPDPEPDAEGRFHRALDRELARARRHDRALALLSAAPEPVQSEMESLSPTLRAIAEARARHEIAAWLAGELQRYAEVAVLGERVVALVPETDEADAQALRARLERSAEASLDPPLGMGIALFPTGALSATDLLEVADRERTGARLRSVPSPAPQEETAEEAPSVAGDAPR